MIAILRKATRWLALLACLTAAAPVLADNDTLGPGDSVRITVFENPDLTTESRLSARGSINFPLLGNVKLGGLTPNEASDRIATLLREKHFVRDPQVTLSVVQFRSRQVSVLGQVMRPGRYTLEESATTLSDILAVAGGVSPTGDDVVTVIRNRNGKAERFDVDLPAMYRSGNLASNYEIQNGDILFVRRAPMFYIYGEVQRAGTYRLEQDMTVMQALSLSGGLTPRGTERGLRIARRGPDGQLAKIEVKPSDKVQPDDIIQVQESLF